MNKIIIEKKEEKNIYKEIIKDLVYISVWMFILAAVFDATVSYTIFIYKEDIFCKHEANEVVRDWWCNEKFNPLSILAILCKLPIFLSIVVVKIFEKYPTKAYGRLLGAMIMWNIVNFGMHLLGGLSWLR